MLVLAAVVAASGAPADVFVTSFWTNEIFRYKNDGNFLGVFVPAYYGGAYRPVALEWGNLGLYVVNDGGDDVVSYHHVTGNAQGVFASGGGLNTPQDAVFAGDLFVTSDQNPDKVLRYDHLTGAFVGVFAAAGGMSRPGGLTWHQGRLYVSSILTDDVVHFDHTGAPLGTFASGGGLDVPEGLTFGPDGHLYVASNWSDEVLRFDGQTGAFMDVFASGIELEGPQEVVFGPDGNLYVGTSSHEVLVYDAAGNYLSVFASGNGLAGPRGILFSPLEKPAPPFDGFGCKGNGWMLVEMPNPIGKPPAVIELGAVAHDAVEGTPAGSATTAGAAGSQLAYAAPAAYLGDRAELFQASFRYDMKVGAGETGSDAVLILVGDGTTLFAASALQPQASWSSLSVPLVGDSFRVNDVSGPVASDAQLQGVLADLGAVYLTAGVSGPGSTGFLDNVGVDGGAPAAVASLCDSEFDPASWTQVIERGAQEVLTLADGGASGNSPDPHREVSSPDDAAHLTWHFSPLLVFDPSSAAIAELDFRIDFREESSVAQGMGFRFALRQGGELHHLDEAMTTAGPPGWRSFSLLGVHAGDFVMTPPDFAPGAAPLEFGYRTSNYDGGGTRVGFDDFEVTVRSLPEPGLLLALGAGKLLLAGLATVRRAARTHEGRGFGVRDGAARRRLLGDPSREASSRGLSASR